MKAAVISLGSKSSEWTKQALGTYFDTADALNLKNVEVRLGPDAGIIYNKKPLKDYDCIYIKGSFRYATLQRAITTYLWGACYLPIKPESFTIVHNKLLTHLELQCQGIPMPRTYMSPTGEAAKALLKDINYPVVMKFPEGTQGKGVMFADSYSSASSMLDALGALKQPFIIQEYIESGSQDIRAFVVGDDVVAGMGRIAHATERRANIHAGGRGIPYELSLHEKRIAVETAHALGVGICGVDMLQGPKGPLVIEANISPGLQGITAATKVDIADNIGRFLHKETETFVHGKKNKETGKIVGEKLAKRNKEFITDLTFRGGRIILPEIVSSLTGFTEKSDYTIVADKGKLKIEEFKVKRT